MKRTHALAAIGATLALPSIARAQDATLKLAGVPEDSVTPALYAEKNGLFRRNGLSVDISAERSGSAISSGVIGGAFQIAKSSLIGLIVAHSKGIPFVLLAAGGMYDSSAPIVELLVKNDSPIKTAADLNGKTVAVSALNDLYSVATREWMAKNGGNPDSIRLIEFPVAAVPDALVAGRIDAGCVIEPALQRALDGKQVHAIAHPFDAIAPRFLYSGWFSTSDWATQNAKTAAGFGRAMRDASLYCNGHKAQTVDLLAAFSGIDATDIAKMTRADCGTALVAASIQPLVDTCAKYKVISATFDARDMIAPAMRGNAGA